MLQPIILAVGDWGNKFDSWVESCWASICPPLPPTFFSFTSLSLSSLYLFHTHLSRYSSSLWQIWCINWASACLPLSLTPSPSFPSFLLTSLSLASRIIYHSPQDVGMTESIHELNLAEHLLASLSILVHFKHHHFARAFVVHLQTLTQ